MLDRSVRKELVCAITLLIFHTERDELGLSTLTLAVAMRFKESSTVF